MLTQIAILCGFAITSMATDLGGWNGGIMRYDHVTGDSLTTTINKQSINSALDRAESFSPDNPTDTAMGQATQAFMDSHTLLSAAGRWH